MKISPQIIELATALFYKRYIIVHKGTYDKKCHLIYECMWTANAQFKTHPHKEYKKLGTYNKQMSLYLGIPMASQCSLKHIQST